MSARRAASTIFGYEADGIDYTMTHGLPFIGEAPVLDRIFGTKRTEQRSRELQPLPPPRTA